MFVRRYKGLSRIVATLIQVMLMLPRPRMKNGLQTYDIVGGSWLMVYAELNQTALLASSPSRSGGHSGVIPQESFHANEAGVHDESSYTTSRVVQWPWAESRRARNRRERKKQNQRNTKDRRSTPISRPRGGHTLLGKASCFLMSRVLRVCRSKQA